MKVVILGDGPAGWLAAITAARAGAQVTLRGLESRDAAQAGHVHILDGRLAAATARFDSELADALNSAAEPWTWKIGPYEDDRSHLSRAAFLKILIARGTALGITVTTDKVLPEKALWIDATGGARTLLRSLDRKGQIAVVLEEHGAPERYSTWTLPATGRSRTTVQDGTARVYIEEDTQHTRVTMITTANTPPPGTKALTRALEAAEWPLQHKPTTSRPAQMIGTPARQLRFIAPAQAPVIAFGDALIQTSPRRGFGLLSAVQQAALLAATLADGPDLIRAALSEYAEEIWHGLALEAALSDEAA